MMEGGGKITKRRKSDPNKQERKFFRRCNECVNCKRVECGQCKHCLDMPKFGGSYKLKKACVDRECVRSRQDNPVLHGVGRGLTGGAGRQQKGVASRIHNQQQHDRNNKGKYYIIPNRSGEMFQVHSLTGTAAPQVTAATKTPTFIPTFVPAPTNSIDLKPRPSMGITHGGKPAQKVYTCSLASAQPASLRQPSHATASINTTLSHRTTTASKPAPPTVNVAAASAAARRQDDESSGSVSGGVVGGGAGLYSMPTTPTEVEQAAANVDIDDFVNKYLKVYYEDSGSLGPLDYLEENLEEFGLEVIADIKFHPSGGGCDSFWGEGASSSWESSSDSGDTRWKDFDDSDLELGLSKLLEYEEDTYTGEPYKNLYRGFCQFCTLNSKCGNCLINNNSKEIRTN